ncbi:Glucosaminyl phosphatidylinositol (GlcN-PI) nositol acylation protein [Microbotryomycetes sp. JL221]|nr:Glucosaminyl phosphatidylinositol (GlcN-PI) nositol acylation protein [Microbotryomycetes sp. JL221]
MTSHASHDAYAAYKQQKELFTTYAWWTVIQPRLLAQTSSRKLANPSSTWRPFVIEFTVLVWPLLASLTILSRNPLLLNGIIVSLTYATCQVSLPPTSPPLSPTQPRTSSPFLDSPTERDQKRAQRQVDSPSKLFIKPFVTVYRAHMMLMTVICILAVDFKVFPRQFAKAETWGTSLMDLGVGSFVFSLGLISALPLLKSTRRLPFLIAAWKVIKKSFGVIVLGIVRVIMVKGVDYPEHLSEYGTHWNFFFTLGLLPVFGVMFERWSPKLDFHAMALAVTLVHQTLLSKTSLQSWTLEAARTTIWSHNKEGLVSLPGYLAIFLLGTGTGLYVLPPDPYFYRILHAYPSRDMTKEAREKLEDKKKRMWQSKPGKLANLLGSYAVIWWTLYAVMRWLGVPVSRRIANLPYVIWTAAFNCSFLFLYLSIHLWATKAPMTRSVQAPALFEAINRNSLVVFLIANLLTGLVNVTIETMYASTMVAMVVLVCYNVAVAASAWLLRHQRLRI